jgi:hypothetical protein
MTKAKNTYGLKIGFTDWDSYQRWLQEWRRIYKSIAVECKDLKNKIKQAQDTKNSTKEMKYREVYLSSSSMAGKLMKLLELAKERWLNIKNLIKEFRKQNRNWPIVIQNVDKIILYFNDDSIEFNWLPQMILSTGIDKYHIKGFECNTRCISGDETQTKTMKIIAIVENVNITVNENGVAIINSNEYS